MKVDHQFLALALAAIVASVYFQQQLGDMKQKLGDCQIEFKGFKDGVIYGK